MVGQDRLVAKLKSYSIATLPHSILLLGEKGCGKHTLAKEVAEYFNLDLVDITESLTTETLNDIKLRATPVLYLISVDELTEKEQNSILKFVEEPSAYAYVMLLGQSQYSMIDTLVNRCVVYQFDKYKSSDLSVFIQEEISNSEDIIDICSTPGQVRLIVNYYDALVKTCSDFVNKLKKASFSNVLVGISNKINYKDEYDKYDFYLFLKVLKREMLKDYSKTHDAEIYDMYNLVLEHTDRLSDTRLDKKVFMDHLLSTMWLKVREAK